MSSRARCRDPSCAGSSRSRALRPAQRPSPGCWRRCRRQASGSRSAPQLLPLPSPRAADAGILLAEVELADILALQQARAFVLQDDAADLEDVAVVGGLQRDV